MSGRIFSIVVAFCLAYLTFISMTGMFVIYPFRCLLRTYCTKSDVGLGRCPQGAYVVCQVFYVVLWIKCLFSPPLPQVHMLKS